MVHDSRLWMYQAGARTIDESSLPRHDVTCKSCWILNLRLLEEWKLTQDKVQMRLRPNVAGEEEEGHVLSRGGEESPACSFLIRSGARTASKFQTDRHVKLSHNSFPTAELHRVVGVCRPAPS